MKKDHTQCILKKRKYSEIKHNKQKFYETDLDLNPYCFVFSCLLYKNNPEEKDWVMERFNFKFYTILHNNNPDNIDNSVDWEIDYE